VIVNGSGVGVSVGVGDASGVGVSLGVGERLGVGDSVGVGVSVGEDVAVDVGLSVGVSDGGSRVGVGWGRTAEQADCRIRTSPTIAPLTTFNLSMFPFLKVACSPSMAEFAGYYRQTENLASDGWGRVVSRITGGDRLGLGHRSSEAGRP